MLDKENAAARKGMFMIDASKGFMQGRQQEPAARAGHPQHRRYIHRQTESAALRPHGAVRGDRDPKNDFNLNLPRYIDSTEPEDLQDIDGHLRGGIPERDIDALDATGRSARRARGAVRQPSRAGYARLAAPAADVKGRDLRPRGVRRVQRRITAHVRRVEGGQRADAARLRPGDHPKALIDELSESLLADFRAAPLIDAYDMYQHLMDYWAATMQDDVYLIAADGWVGRTTRIYRNRQEGGRLKDKGWTCDLVPKPYIIARDFAPDQAAIDARQAGLAATEGQHGRIGRRTWW